MDPALGLRHGEVRVVPYDLRWPELFAAESARLREALEPHRVQLEHTGSTAVPGLAAKPVLDILAGYADRAVVPEVISRLQSAGYVHRGPQGIADREFFRRGEPRSYHIHLTQIGSRFWRDHLTFRDRLRADPRLRAQYATLKLRLAAEYPNDREKYIEGKAAFVETVLKGTS